ncbi:hypothetical protein MTO96_030350, partial [Rhipicephalus appendiculatus]
PGYVKTTLMMKPGVSVEEHMEIIEKSAGPAHAMGRVGAPEEVARCIAFLASDDASFMTGATVAVDGGLLLLSSVSGASAGIGESTAKHFASLGCGLTLFARSADNLERVAEDCCAMGLPRDKASSCAVEIKVYKSNVVNVSSISASIPTQVGVPYGVSKAALEHLTRCAALENAPCGVRVNAIRLGLIRTMMARRPGVSVEEFMKNMEKMASIRHALGRLGTPEEVARCIAFLASDDAGFVTGITMPVDGGYLLLPSVNSAVLM